MANTDNQSSRWRSWHYILLWLVALTSLALNVFMLVGLYNFRRAAQEEISRVSQILDGVEIENYDLPIFGRLTIICCGIDAVLAF